MEMEVLRLGLERGRRALGATALFHFIWVSFCRLHSTAGEKGGWMDEWTRVMKLGIKRREKQAVQPECFKQDQQKKGMRSGMAKKH
jgi:hypothetical protein